MLTTNSQNSLEVTDKSQSLAKKIRIFFGVWLLTDIVLLDVVLKYIDRLNQIGIIKMGDTFSAEQIFWGNSVIANILHLAITVVFAGIFGLIYGYLRRKVTEKEKILVSVLNPLLIIFAPILIIFVVLLATGQMSLFDAKDALTTVFNDIFSSSFYSIFLFLNIVGAFVSSFFCINIGSDIINNPYHTLDKGEKTTLLGIKWYHYFWLWITIGLYGGLFLGYVTEIAITLINLIKTVKWFEFLGVTTSNSGNNTLDSILGVLFFGTMIAFISIALLEYLRKILAGETNQKLAIRISLSLLIGIIIPIGALFLINNTLF